MFISVIIVFLLLAPNFSLAKNDSLEEQSNQDIFKINAKKITELTLNKNEIIQTKRVSTISFGNFSNEKAIIPSDQFIIQKHPQFATDNQRILVLAETKENQTMKTQLTATYSENGGETFSERMTISHALTDFKLPALDYTGDPEMQAYGSHMIDPETGMQMIFGFPNITNPNTNYEGSATDFNMGGWFDGRLLIWNNTYWKYIGDTATAGYMHGTDVGPYKNFHGLTVWAGHNGNDWSYYFYLDTDESIEDPYKILWKGYLNGTVLNVDVDIDLATGWQYDLCELLNRTTQKPEIQIDMLHIEPGVQKWYEREENYGPSWVFKDYRNPALKASKGYVYIACEKDGDIFLHHSFNRGKNYLTSKLTDTEDFETQPSVTACGEIVTVTYVKNNNLYMVNSEHGGVGWSEPVLLNEQENNVSKDKNNVDIDGNYIIWTNKQKNSTLYFNLINVSAPLIQIVNITGGTKISADIKNTGTADANNLTYQIIINSGLLLTKRKTTGTVNVSVGETVRISTDGIILGFGKPTLRVQAGTLTKTAKATLFLFFVKIN
jgi:hypothetical protein